MYDRRPRIAMLFAGFLCLLFIIGIISLVLHSTPTYSITNSYQPTPSALSAAAPFSTNSIVYSNGYALALYNYTSGQTTQLSPVVELSGSPIDTVSVSSNNQYVLFHDEQVSSAGSLYQQLINDNLNPQTDYWWLYSVASKSFTPLPNSPLLAQFNGNTIEVLHDAGGDESLQAFTPSNVSTPSSSISIPGSSSFYGTGSGFLLETPDNRILTTSNGVVSRVIANNATLVGVTANGQRAVAVIGQGTARQLVLINLADNDTQKILATNIVGQPAWSADGAVLYTINSSSNASQTSLYSYDLNTNKKWLWQFSGSVAGLETASLKPILFAGTQTAIVGTSSSNYYLIQPNTK